MNARTPAFVADDRARLCADAFFRVQLAKLQLGGHRVESPTAFARRWGMTLAGLDWCAQYLYGENARGER